MQVKSANPIDRYLGALARVCAACGTGASSGVEEADEFLVPVMLHVSTDAGAVEHVESGDKVVVR